ncbi:hypothetical protein MUK42_34934 [Musa troglodytarum]|uniref:Uncharacterized protein n=1 Tax=Musa troglodytarum TaxID=320322 RepID=A0A9E7JCD4_9LILI|nr:hypothetical protein MUK42_34934 [Musa troglodytarum]
MRERSCKLGGWVGSGALPAGSPRGESEEAIEIEIVSEAAPRPFALFPFYRRPREIHRRGGEVLVNAAIFIRSFSHLSLASPPVLASVGCRERRRRRSEGKSAPGTVLLNDPFGFSFFYRNSI